MEVTEQHILYIMLYEYQQGKTATTTVKKIEEVYGDGVLSVRKCKRWFCEFRQGDLSLQDTSRSGRPASLGNDALKAATDRNPFATVEGLAEEVDSFSSTVHRHLQKLGLVSKLGKWLPQTCRALRELHQFRWTLYY